MFTSGEGANTAAQQPTTQFYPEGKFMINALMELPSDVASNLDATD